MLRRVRSDSLTVAASERFMSLSKCAATAAHHLAPSSPLLPPVHVGLCGGGGVSARIFPSRFHLLFLLGGFFFFQSSVDEGWKSLAVSGDSHNPVGIVLVASRSLYM